MSFTGTWNLVKQFAAFPCAQPNPIIAAVTLVPAVAPALLEWVSFGCRDILKFRLGHGAPCGRAMKAQVAKAIPPAFADTTNFLLKWEHRFSVAGQWFLLADLISDSLARWTTLAYQLEGCPDALEGAYWQYDNSTPEAVLANTPTIIGGAIINEHGTPGIAWPTGAIAPADWYTDITFEVKAQSIFDHEPINLDVWVQVNDTHSSYDFPANRYNAGYPGFLFPSGEGTQKGSYLLNTQNTRAHTVQYTMYVQSSVNCLAWITSGSGQCTPFPPYKEFLSPLACLRDLTVERIEDPANRNHAGRQPTMVQKFLNTTVGQPVHGAPGGKPRSRK